MKRYYWAACLLWTVIGAPRVAADPLDLRVGQPFPTDLLLPFIEDPPQAKPSSADLFLGKKTIVQVFASW